MEKSSGGPEAQSRPPVGQRAAVGAYIAPGKRRPMAEQWRPSIPEEAMGKAEIAMVRARSWERARGALFGFGASSGASEARGDALSEGCLREEKAFRPVHLLLPSGLRRLTSRFGPTLNKSQSLLGLILRLVALRLPEDGVCLSVV